MTVRALRELQNADVVVSDYLVSKETLALVQKHQVLHVAKKRKCGQHAGQAELNEICKNALERGKRVVRLKGGDPYVFGRGYEEVQYYRNLGYVPLVVPGISSSLSAPLLGGVSLTSRDPSAHANQILVATGTGVRGDACEIPEYCDKRTTVFLMAIKRLGGIMESLVTVGGYPADLPVAIIEKASTPHQRVTRGTVKTISAIAAHRGVAAPAVIVVGKRAHADATAHATV